MTVIDRGLTLIAKADSQTLAPEAVQHAQAAWSDQIWPTRKTEAWKYTPLRPLADGRYFCAPPVNTQTQELKALFEIEGLDAIQLVFVDGVLNATLSNDLQQLPSGLSVTTFDKASVAQKAMIAQKLDSAAAEHATLFGQLNTATTEQGVFIDVEKNAQIMQPVHIVHIATHTQEAAANARVLWHQGVGSQASLIEHFVGVDNAKLFTHSVTELLVSDNASCTHYRLHLEPEESLHIGGVYSHLHKHSRLNSFYLAMGTQLQRVDVVTQFEGEGAEATNNGVYLPRNNQLVDFHTCIEHKVPHCTSNEIFRGIIGDHAKAVFNGRIHIHRDAQKTLAELSNKNLLTSATAKVNTKPELEIYADDVRCAHGATVAELDELAMHYLRTRGISREEAQVMLSFGFINELIEQLANDAVVHYLRPFIANRFAKDPSLTQHLIA